MQLIVIIAVVALNLNAQSTAAYSCNECWYDNAQPKVNDTCPKTEPDVGSCTSDVACFNYYAHVSGRPENETLLIRGCSNVMYNISVYKGWGNCSLYNEGLWYGVKCTCESEHCNDGPPRNPDTYPATATPAGPAVRPTGTTPASDAMVPNLMCIGKLSMFIVSATAAIFVRIGGEFTC